MLTLLSARTSTTTHTAIGAPGLAARCPRGRSALYSTEVIERAIKEIEKLQAAVVALAEMVEIYQDEERGGVPLPPDEQPTCIKRALDALAKASD